MIIRLIGLFIVLALLSVVRRLIRVTRRGVVLQPRPVYIGLAAMVLAIGVGLEYIVWGYGLSFYLVEVEGIIVALLIGWVFADINLAKRRSRRNRDNRKA